MNETIHVVPVVALRGTVILPGMIVHFDVSREKSRAAVSEAMMRDQTIFLVAQRLLSVEQPSKEDLFTVGTLAHVRQLVKMKNNVIRVMVEGQKRATLKQFLSTEKFLEGEVEELPDEEDIFVPKNAREAMRRNLLDLLENYAAANPQFSRELAARLPEVGGLVQLVDHLCVHLPLNWKQQQVLLETVSQVERYQAIGAVLANEAEIFQIKADIQQKMKAAVDKNQKDYLLREQMKVIRKELGEDDFEDESEIFLKKTEELQASEEVKTKLRKEIRRFKQLGNNPSEGPLVRNYIETLLGLPWEAMSKDRTDLKKARQILDRDHYGLDKVKERILEYLSVRKLTKKGDAPILCLVGPPGTGKTSIARSVAESLNREYIRICLGGVSDEAEIRGHRRTYVGAMPGRIVTALQKCGVRNPLMLLDEIDKMGSNYKGDPAAAMLEVLDGEQNAHFSDHYIELPFDLSEVLFIATANDVSGISRPLLDRMEIIEISGYTENEKLHIGAKYLVPKQKKVNGLKAAQLDISEKALKAMISGYTREAGVRSLERKIGQICRKAARQVVEDKEKSVEVKAKNLEEYLGKARYSADTINDADEVGIVRGLAWTSVGGDTLEIEVNVMDGKGQLVLTGNLGDVMKESARIALSYVRSAVTDDRLDAEYFDKHDVHIHVPEGAVPKDGPSAGVTMATAIYSALTERRVRADVAMTGEVTLRGRVLPIGGLKEKLLAANMAGVKLALVPEKNRPDVEELDPEITEGMEVAYVKGMDQVLSYALI